ncbi:Prophage CP4-57 regulatory protein (AlpA) [compost metagenome]
MTNRLDRFMREKEVLSVTSFSRTTLWREIKRGRFPSSVVISAGRVGWRESAIAAWQRSPESWKEHKSIEAA